MSWFKRTAKGIQTSTEEKKDIPKGLWFKSPSGNIVEQDELVTNFYALSVRSIFKYCLTIMSSKN